MMEMAGNMIQLKSLWSAFNSRSACYLRSYTNSIAGLATEVVLASCVSE